MIKKIMLIVGLFITASASFSQQIALDRDEITLLQKLLSTLNYPTVADGAWGPKSQRSLDSFYRDNEGVFDGVLDKTELQELINAVEQGGINDIRKNEPIIKPLSGERTKSEVASRGQLQHFYCSGEIRMPRGYMPFTFPECYLEQKKINFPDYLECDSQKVELYEATEKVFLGFAYGDSLYDTACALKKGDADEVVAISLKTSYEGQAWDFPNTEVLPGDINLGELTRAKIVMDMMPRIVFSDFKIGDQSFRGKIDFSCLKFSTLGIVNERLEQGLWADKINRGNGLEYLICEPTEYLFYSDLIGTDTAEKNHFLTSKFVVQKMCEDLSKRGWEADVRDCKKIKDSNLSGISFRSQLGDSIRVVANRCISGCNWGARFDITIRAKPFNRINKYRTFYTDAQKLVKTVPDSVKELDF